MWIVTESAYWTTGWSMSVTRRLGHLLRRVREIRRERGHGHNERRLDCEANEPDPIVAPKSFQRSGMSQFGILRDQALKERAPLDKNLRRADGRPVLNRKSEIGFLSVNLVNQALEKAPPLNPSRTLQNGCKVETRMQELTSTSKLGTMNLSTDHRELELRWGCGHSCKILGSVKKGNKNIWSASPPSYSTSRDALRSLYEHANKETMSREYAVSNLPKNLNSTAVGIASRLSRTSCKRLSPGRSATFCANWSRNERSL